jgi:mannose-6-phosphate isomerase-like protein (cupin superfamily)
MNRTTFVASVGLAFIAGCGAARWLPQASAADAMTPQIIHVPELSGDALGPVMGPPVAGLRSKTFVSAEGMTVSVQAGPVPKHLHEHSNELQYILEGTGTIWLGDKEVRVQPGDLVVIPKGTPHGGTKPDSGVFKSIAIKTPPQVTGDTKMLP